jgi:predicted secreted hydrolase
MLTFLKLFVVLFLAGLSLAEPRWEQAPLGYGVALPKDHGAHAQQRIEWWYFTGNLRTEDGRELGYQLTFFRIGVQVEPVNPSPWAVRDLHMVHFAVSDLAGGKYYSAQRLDRSGPGLCGAAADGLHVWHEQWVAEALPDGSIRLAADEPGFALELNLALAGPLLLHGEAGYSKKGSQEGNASIYYSLTRLKSTGRVRLGSAWQAVTGLSWMDHEFGTSFLEKGQKGWDWFSLHLDDGSDVMLFQLRQEAAGGVQHSAGTLRRADGRVVSLRSGEFSLTSSQPWKSAVTGAEYPLEWKISIPSQKLTLTATTPLREQEMAGKGGPSYWEGAIRATGAVGTAAVKGSGYLEMTGYGGQGMGQFFAMPE